MKTLLLTLCMTLVTFGSFATNGPEKKGYVAPVIENMEEVIDQLVYPIEARKNAIEGKVTVRFVVDEDGKIIKSTVVQACDPVLEAAMTKVVDQFEFTPATLNGLATAGKVTVPFRFKLEID